MKPLYLTLILIFLSLVPVFSQKQLTINDLPDEIFGDYLNSEGRWSADLNKDFFINYPNSQAGYFETIEKEADIYNIIVKRYSEADGSYSIKLKIGKQDTIWIAEEADNWTFKPYKKIPEQDVAFPEGPKIIEQGIGDWYLTDGSDEKYISVYKDSLVFENESYTYNRFIKFQNTQQVNISGPRFGRYIHLKYARPNYIGIKILGENDRFLKRYSQMPDMESSTFEEIPAALLGKWFATNGSDLEMELLSDYKAVLNKDTLRLKRLNVNNQNVTVLVKTKAGEDLEWTLTNSEGSYCRVSFHDGDSFYMKNSKDLPDGKIVDNEFIGEWFACDGSKAKLLVGTDMIISKKSKIKTDYDLFVSDGQQFKALSENKPEVYFRKISDNYMEMRSGADKEYKMFKKSTSLPDEAVVQFPTHLKTNWIDKTSGEWKLSLTDNFSIYKNDFWTNKAVSYSGGEYKITLEKTDTICYYNAQGDYVCELIPRSVFLKIKLNGSEVMMHDGNAAYACVNKITKADYRPKDTLPLNSKPGTAVMKGHFSNMPKEFKNGIIEFYVNDIIYGNQVKYTARVTDDNRFQVSMPLPSAQDVMFRMGGLFGSVFLAPEDTLMVLIDGSIHTRQLADNAIWMGQYAALNRDLSNYIKEKNTQGYGFQQLDEKNMTLEPEEYKASRKKLEENNLAKIEEFLSQNKVSPGFKDWLYINQEIEHFDGLMRYRWMRYIRHKIEQLQSHPTYFSFIDSLDISDPKYRVSNSFQRYLHELNMHFNKSRSYSTSLIWQYLLNNDSLLTEEERTVVQNYVDSNMEESIKLLNEFFNKNHNAIVEWQKNNPEEGSSTVGIFNHLKKTDKTLTASQVKGIELYLEDIEKNGMVYNAISSRLKDLFNEMQTEGYITDLLEQYEVTPSPDFLKQYVLTSTFYSFVDRAEEIPAKKAWEMAQKAGLSQEQMAHLDIVYDKFLEELEKPLPEYCNLNDAPQGSADELMANIAKKHAGKVIYIDVWAPWCGPCRSEFSRSEPMKNALKEKDVAFVYICGSGEKSAWESVIKKYDLQGDHYYLEASTYADLGAKFNITGIPRYMIMNKKGQVVNKTAPRPSTLSMLVEEIDKYLEE